MASTNLLCPNQHENLPGLSCCKVCGLPLLDLSVLFDALAESLVSRADMSRPLPDSVLIGLGTSGAALVDVARATHTSPIPNRIYVAIDGKPLDAGIEPSDVLRLPLGGSQSNTGTFCGIGQTFVEKDPYLMPFLRKAGFGRVSGRQTVFVISAIGGGIGSAASAIIEKCRMLNSECHSVALVVVPGTDESYHIRVNAYYGLSRLLQKGGRAAELVVPVHYDRVKKIRGVGASAEELRTEGVLAALADLLIENLSPATLSEVVRINRSMGITLVVPCLALGRSLEIFGNLRNILESSISFPTNNIAKEAVLVCHLVLRVPASRATAFAEEAVSEELAGLIRKHLPRVRSTSLSISFSEEQHDRVDACLLLGGDGYTNVLFADGDASEFQEELKGSTSWETYGLTLEDMQKASSALDDYDWQLGKPRSRRKRTGR